MINALSSNQSPMSSSGANPSSSHSDMLPPQGKPMMGNTAPSASAGGSNAPKAGMASKFTAKAIVGLLILLLLVVGSGFALYTSQQAAQQAGIGNIEPKAAGGTPTYKYAKPSPNPGHCNLGDHSCDVGNDYNQNGCYVNHWVCDGVETGGGCQDEAVYSGQAASFDESRKCGTQQIDTRPECCQNPINNKFCESISVAWDIPCVSPEPEPEPTPTPPTPLSCNGICASDAECQQIDPGYVCSAVNADNISWPAAEPWSGPIAITALPGTGGMQSQGSFIIPATSTSQGVLVQTLWRANQGWSRAVPLLADGTPNWSVAPAWSGPVNISSLPGTGSIQTEVNVVMPTAPAKTLIQAFWRGDQGWMRTVPFNSDNNSVNYAAASPWTGPIAISTIPGSGTMWAQDGYVSNNTYFHSFSRGDSNWFRSVPLENGIPNWGAASSWTSTPIANLPGTGTLDSNVNVIMGNGYVLQGIWQGQQGWSRLIPMGRRCRLGSNLSSPQCTPIAPPPSSPTPSPLSCNWLQVVTPNGGGNLLPGQAALMGSAASAPVTDFFYAVYNKDNLYDNGTPKPVCVTAGGDVTITDENGDQCPGADVHHLIFKNPNLQSRLESGNISRTYEQIFLNDQNWGGAKLVHAQINAFMSINNGTWTAPVAACVKYANAQVPPNSPTPQPPTSPTPQPPTSPTPVPPMSPTPVAPMCMSITMSNANPTLGSNVTFTCGLVTGATWYDFRVVSPAGKISSLSATGRTSSPYTIDAYGTYYAQCRYCTSPVGSACDQPFEPLPGGILPTPTIAPATPKLSPDPNIDPPPDPDLSPMPTSVPSPTIVPASPKPTPTIMPASPKPSPTLGINPSPSANPGVDTQQ